MKKIYLDLSRSIYVDLQMKCTQSCYLDKVHEDIDKLFYLYEVHEDIAETLHVVPSALLDAKVGVDRGVPSCPREVLVFSAKRFLYMWHVQIFCFLLAR